MKLFDEDGNYVGEFLMNSVEEVKDTATSTLEGGDWILGLLLLIFILPGWALLAGAIFLVISAIWWVIKLAINIAWWIARTPFTLLFYGELPEF